MSAAPSATYSSDQDMLQGALGWRQMLTACWFMTSYLKHNGHLQHTANTNWMGHLMPANTGARIPAHARQHLTCTPIHAQHCGAPVAGLPAMTMWVTSAASDCRDVSRLHLNGAMHGRGMPGTVMLRKATCHCGQVVVISPAASKMNPSACLACRNSILTSKCASRSADCDGAWHAGRMPWQPVGRAVRWLTSESIARAAHPPGCSFAVKKQAP
jgi:hypothetical protein